MMGNKKTLAIAGVVAIIAAVSVIYMYENSYSSVSVGQAHYENIPFDKEVEWSDFALIGTVVDKEVVLLQYDTMNTDENGVEYVADSDRRPFQKITLRVDEYFRDTTGSFDPMFVFYEMSTDGIGWDNDMRTMYYVPKPQTYSLGDQNLYFIGTESDYPGKYVIGGHGDKYDIITADNGTKYIQSEMGIHFGNPPRLYSDAVADIIAISNKSMTPEMIQKRDNYKP